MDYVKVLYHLIKIYKNLDKKEKLTEIKLNYPVVLVHGIAAPGRRSAANFWGRIPSVLERKGVQVFIGDNIPWGYYESNALLLKKLIEKILLETGKEKVNIIAHSKGGLDARYLIWKHAFGGKVASLTTICTPHNGSEIADLIHKQTLNPTKASSKALELYGKLSRDISPGIYNVNYQLTTMNMKDFNREVAMDNSVYYQSLYTTMKNAFDDPLFYHTYQYIKKIIGANDGLVSVYSTLWGSNHRKLAGGISHTEIQDLKKKRISGRNIPDIYISILNDLGERGF